MASTLANPSEKVRIGKFWHCQFCNVKAPSERQLDIHLKGKKHLKKIASAKKEESKVVGVEKKKKEKFAIVEIPKNISKESNENESGSEEVELEQFMEETATQGAEENDSISNEGKELEEKVKMGDTKNNPILLDDNMETKEKEERKKEEEERIEVIEKEKPTKVLEKVVPRNKPVEAPKEIRKTKLSSDATPFIPLSRASAHSQNKKALPHSIPEVNLQGDVYLSSPPWLFDSSSVTTLDDEIRNFCDYISPTPQERAMRSIVVSRLKKIILGIWPRCSAEVFGSYSTDLYLPSSDIDICVLWVKEPNALFKLANEIRNTRISSYMSVISKAKVPIIKMIDRESGCQVDICFGNHNGPRNTQYASKLLEQYPLARPLTLVVKYYIAQFGLNEVFTGGVSSYTLLLMAISFLQLREPKITGKDPKDVDLGRLLVEFLKLYGLDFNYVNVGISVRDGGSYFQKATRGWLNPAQPFALAIEDPDDVDNDVSKSSYLILDVRAAFAHAYYALIAANSRVPTPLCRIFLRDRKMEFVRANWERQYFHLVSPRYESANSPRERKRSRSINRARVEGRDPQANYKRRISTDKGEQKKKDKSQRIKNDKNKRRVDSGLNMALKWQR